MKFLQSCLVLLLFCSHVSGVTLEQVISREHPDMEVNGKLLGIGQDGRVYVGNTNGYVLRFNPDGTGKFGGKAPMALKGLIANKDGVIATSHCHMNAAIRLWTPAFGEISTVREFVSNDALGWDDPSDIQVGASGDFYAPDQNRNRIVRVSQAGKLIETYSLEATGEKYEHRIIRIRVNEPLKRFYVGSAENGIIHAITFEGKQLWTVQGPTFDNIYFSAGGDFEADDEGNLYVLPEGADTISVFDPDGKPNGSIQLKGGDPKGKCLFLRLGKDDIFLKRKHPSELFQVYDRRTGEFRRVVHANVEHLRVEFPSQIWTAGQPLPLTISLQKQDRTTHPNWPVEISRFNDPQWTTLPLVDGKITPPVDAAGLYRLRVLFGEYQLFDVVEIRVPESKGTLNILTPLNRIYYGRGEEIPIKIIVRADPKDAPAEINCRLLDVAGQEVIAKKATFAEGSASVTLPKKMTSALRPGRYLLTTDAAHLTVAPQPLIIGPGFLHGHPLFNVVEYIDGGGVQAPGSYKNLPENVASHLQRGLKLGTNLFVDYAEASPGYHESTRLGLEPIVERLKKDPLGIAPEKAVMEESEKQLLAGYSAHGTEKMNLLIWVDSAAPFGDSTAHTQAMENTKKGIKERTTDRLSYPAFRGWSWWQHLWVDRPRVTNEAILKKWGTLRDTALATGKWNPEIETISDSWISVLPQIEVGFHSALRAAAADKISAMAGPYRQPGVIPPTTFSGANEIDLQFQSEQIQTPQSTPHNVDYYKRPGKRAWGHPEIINEDGTGGLIAPNMLQMVMRGVDGVGWSGRLPVGRGGGSYIGVGMGVDDPRTTGRGDPSVGRALGTLLRQYGPWLTKLEANDRIAIVVSTRMLRLDQWGSGIGGGGDYFTRLYEAYQACLYAHRPASFVFTEELRPNSLKNYKAVLVVGQLVEFDPPLAAALSETQKAGVGVFYDAVCRPEFVHAFHPLNFGFVHVEHDGSMWNDDSTYQRWPHYFQEDAAKLVAVLGTSITPVAKVDNPEILLSERKNGQGRFVWAVNNDYFDWDADAMWRVSMFISNRVPQTVPIDLSVAGQTVYEVFGMRPLTESVIDLRTMPARLFAVLPKPIESLKLSAPTEVKAGATFPWKVTIAGPEMSYPLQVRLMDEAGQTIDEFYPTETAGSLVMPVNGGKTLTLEARELISGKGGKATIASTNDRGKSPPGIVTSRPPVPIEQLFGSHLRNVVVSADGSTALINAGNWNDNVYLIDTKSGKVRSQSNVGHHYAYGPVRAGKHFFVQGYDLNSIEGYHLYQLDADGRAQRRFATYGVPSRGTRWYGMSYYDERINNYAVSSSGSWIASAGNLGLIVWSPSGKKLWSLDWWKSPPPNPPVVGQDDEGGFYQLAAARQSMLLLAQGEKTLISLEGGMRVTARNAMTGTVEWNLKLADTGLIYGGAVSEDGRTLAAFSNTEGGRLFVIRDGKVISTLSVMADQVLLTPDGRYLAVVVGNDLRWCSAKGEALWSFSGDDSSYNPHPIYMPLHEPRISPDGKRIVFGTCTGMLYVLDDQGKTLFERDLVAMPVATWLSNEELLVATWMGTVMRSDIYGTESWRVRLEPQGKVEQTISVDSTPTSRATWSNATDKPDPLTPNLLKQLPVQIQPASDRPPYGPFHTLQNPVEMLYDGQPTPPQKPWLDWVTVQIADSGWTGKWTLLFDFAKAKPRVTGITVVEDPDHPRSWMRDVLAQYWDEKQGWLDGAYLLSDSAVHTHHFEQPIEASRFRLIGRDRKGWPVGNLRFGEIVFHGESLNPSR